MEQEINQLQTSPVAGVPVELPKQNKPKNIFLIFLGLAVFAGAIFAAYFFGKKTPPPTVPVQTVSPTSVPTPDPTANWKTYTNTKYNYQLLYPSNWSVSSFNNEEQLIQTSEVNFRMKIDETPTVSGFELSVISNPKNLPLTEWITQNSDNGSLLLGTDKIDSEVVSINGLSWEKINNDSIGYIPAGNVKYGLAYNKNLYYVVIYSADVKTIDQILSTFKFLENDSEDVQETTGTATGRLCYPSDFLPPGEIVAKDVSTEEVFRQEYVGTTAGGKNLYTFELSPGNYYFRYEAHASLSKPDIFTSGYYTFCSVHLDQCAGDQNHDLLEVEVKAGETLSGIDLCDFYYGPKNEPEF